MQSDPSAPSSDLEKARALSRRLRSPRPRGVSRPTAPSAEVRPVPPTPEVPPAAPSVEDVSGMVSWEADNLGSRFWNDLLSQCLEIAQGEGASAAFAVDGQGLSIAQLGDLDSEEIEGTGSRLVIALEQAARMETFASRRPGSILIEFGERWLTGFAIQCANETRIVLGLIARDPLSERSRDLVVGLVTELTSGMASA